MLTYNKFLRNELSLVRSEKRNLEIALEKRDSNLNYTREELRINKDELNSLKNNVKDLYYVLKTIKSISEDSAIQVLCTIKMEDIKRIQGVYIHEDEEE